MTLAETYAGKFVVKGTFGKFNATGADVTINQLQRCASGIIGNKKEEMRSNVGAHLSWYAGYKQLIQGIVGLVAVYQRNMSSVKPK